MPFRGRGLDYAPLAVYAMMLSRPQALERELAGIDTHHQLRRYGVMQLGILLPLSLVLVWARARLRARH